MLQACLTCKNQMIRSMNCKLIIKLINLYQISQYPILLENVAISKFSFSTGQCSNWASYSDFLCQDAWNSERLQRFTLDLVGSLSVYSIFCSSSSKIYSSSHFELRGISSSTTSIPAKWRDVKNLLGVFFLYLSAIVIIVGLIVVSYLYYSISMIRGYLIDFQSI